MSTETDEKVEIDVDLEKEVPCDVPECENAIAWLGRRPCCGARSVLCEKHHAYILFNENKASNLDAAGLVRSKCAGCGESPFRPNIWIKL